MLVPLDAYQNANKQVVEYLGEKSLKHCFCMENPPKEFGAWGGMKNGGNVVGELCYENYQFFFLIYSMEKYNFLP